MSYAALTALECRHCSTTEVPLVVSPMAVLQVVNVQCLSYHDIIDGVKDLDWQQ